MVDESGLDIPESNREIALHLRAIRSDIANINSRFDSFEKAFQEDISHVNTRLDNFEQTVQDRRFKFQDVLLSSLIFPIVGGILLFLLTKALG